jgi:group II intron reverse transcriptase/maturase
MTQGITNETADGMSMKKIQAIIAKLKSETYRWTPVKRTYKKKKNGKQRPLGLPTWSDKLLQEAIRLIMDAYYDKQFSCNSHGFRKNKGCKTALEALIHKEKGWKSIKWFIEFDVSNCFDNIDHQTLLNILSEQIVDKRFLRLIETFLKSGYMENWKYNKTLSGCPQGSILSPLLSNVYMNKLDQYVDCTLLPKHTVGKARAASKDYRAIMNQKYKYIKKGNWAKVKELEKIAYTMPSRDVFDANFKRLRYIRYADDWLIGISGSRKDAEEVKAYIATFLHTELKLELSQEKTLITHAKSEKARFLGYDVHTLHDDTKHDRRGHRSINEKIGLRVPRDKMQAKMSKYKAKGKPTHRAEYTIHSDFDIVSQFQSEFRGFAQFYLHAYNAHQMSVVKRTMELSLAKTLAWKHKTTSNKIYRKYMATVETKDGTYRVLQIVVKRENKKPLIAQYGGIKLAYNRNADVNDTPKQSFNIRTQLIDRMMRDVCELCGSKTDVQMHHVKKLKDLRRVDKVNKPEWMKRMIAMNRKTLAVCSECHHLIHAGKYDGIRVH